MLFDMLNNLSPIEVFTLAIKFRVLQNPRLPIQQALAAHREHYPNIPVEHVINAVARIMVATDFPQYCELLIRERVPYFTGLAEAIIIDLNEIQRDISSNHQNNPLYRLLLGEYAPELVSNFSEWQWARSQMDRHIKSLHILLRICRDIGMIDAAWTPEIETLLAQIATNLPANEVLLFRSFVRTSTSFEDFQLKPAEHSRLAADLNNLEYLMIPLQRAMASPNYFQPPLSDREAREFLELWYSVDIALQNPSLISEHVERWETLWTKLQTRPISDYASNIFQSRIGALWSQLYSLESSDISAEKTLQNLTKVLENHDVEPDQLAEATYNLGTFYALRYVRGAGKENHDLAIQYLNKAMQHYDRQHEPGTWADIQRGLGALLMHQYRLTRDEACADDAYRFFSAAIEVEELADRDGWANTQLNIGMLATMRYEHHEEQKWFSLAEQAYEAALKIWNKIEAPLNWALVRMHTGALWLTCYRETLDESNAELASLALHDALTILTPHYAPFAWAMAHQTLISLRTVRFHSHEDRQELAAAQRDLLEVLETAKGHSGTQELAGLHLSLAVVSIRLYENTGEANIADTAQTALDTADEYFQRLPMSIPWVQTHEARGVLALARFKHIGQETDAALAEATFTRVLEVWNPSEHPLDWARIQINLAVIYTERYRRHKSSTDANKALRYYESILQEVGEGVLPPGYLLRIGSGMSFLLTQEQNWPELIRVGRFTEAALEELYRLQVTRQSKETWLRYAKGISTHFAYALAQMGQIEAGVVALERGRTRLLAETLEREQAELDAIESVAPQLVEQYRKVVRQISQIEVRGFQTIVSDWEGTSNDLIQLRAAYSELHEIIDKIRRLADWTNFLTLPNFSELTAVAADRTLVYIAMTDWGGAGFIVHGREVDFLTLPITGDILEEIFTYFSPLERSTPSTYLPGASIERNSLIALLDKALPVIGAKMMAPLATKLRELGATKVVLIPVGMLNTLPLHAAVYNWNNSSLCLIDEFEVSYAPSARVLAAAEKGRESNSCRLIAVGNPLPTPPGLSNLSHARAEAENISLIFGEERSFVFSENDAKPDVLLSAMQGASNLHFACHGVFNPEHPLESQLWLSGSPLTLGDLMREPGLLNDTQLVVLSACTSSLPNYFQLPDETLGLPAGFLRAGASGVIGALWMTDDYVTRLLMERFYRFYLIDHLSPAPALLSAQKWLRQATRRDIIDHHISMESKGSLFARWAIRNMKLELEPDNNQPYASSYYWAPFIYVGASLSFSLGDST